MLNKWFIWVVCLIGLIGLMVYYKHNNESEIKANTTAVTTTSQSTETALQQNTELTSSVQNKEAKKSNLQTDNMTSEQQAILSEIENRIFSEDTYVELISLSAQVGLCRDEIDIPSFFISTGNNYQKQQDLANSLKKVCEQFSHKYSLIPSML